MLDQAILHTDGGSRGNPGPSGIGFVILADDGREMLTICEGGAFIGTATNNEAEYQAMLWGLENAVFLGVEHLEIRADSELLIKQVRGEYKVRSESIKPLYQQVMKTLRSLKSYNIAHVYRNDNAHADNLANKAMDAKDCLGTYQVPCSAAVPGLPKSQVSQCLQGQLTMGQLSQDQSAVGQTPQNQAEQTQPEQNQLAQSAPIQDTNKGGAMTSGIYTLSVKDHFDAAHALVGYPGECRQLHGHTWDIEVTVSGTTLDEVGIVYDFKSLKADLAAILAGYDHVFLNDVAPFDSINATAENLARIIYEQLEESLPSNITLDEVAVWESPIAKLTYRKR